MPLQTLLDTSAFLRWLDGSLPARIQRRLDKADLIVSIVSPWEIAIKRELRALGFGAGVAEKKLEDMGAYLLPVKLRHADVLFDLPMHHKDPFDRMLIAQAIAEGYTLVSPDERMPLYKSAGLKVLWD